MAEKFLTRLIQPTQKTALLISALEQHAVKKMINLSNKAAKRFRIKMKRMTMGLYSPEQINTLEMAINQCLFSYLSAERNGYLTPVEAVERYVKGETL